ncbi:MAG: TIGR01620 family protein [Cohaesibacter sp.]|nr:TIGR01620 family protein [Cohaesibacter sp.]MCV6600227.1 TIGR01620 family protein [Cohaesibacter sp.]
MTSSPSNSNKTRQSTKARKPRAVKLDRSSKKHAAPTPDEQTNAQLSMAPSTAWQEDQDPIHSLNNDQQSPDLTLKKGWSLAPIFWSAFTGLFLLAFGVWLDDLIRTLFTRFEWLGWTGIALLGLAASSLLIFLLREGLALRRLAKLDHLRKQAEHLYEQGNKKSATRFANQMLTLYAQQPSLFKARQSLKSDLPHLFDADAILAQTEQVLISQIDAAANHRVHQAAKRVALVTALSPRALFDILVVLIETIRMVRAIAQSYGNRPGFIAMLKLSGHIAGHLAITGGMAAGETLLQQIVGHGLAARLSAKLGEGLLNGILTARIGLATIALCRPMPFKHAPAPTLGAVIKALRDQSDQQEGTDNRQP